MQVAFGESAESKSTVYRWLERFKDDRQTLEDDPPSGHPRTATTYEKIHSAENILTKDRRVTVLLPWESAPAGIMRSPHTSRYDEGFCQTGVSSFAA